jgi:feruloyl esterase
VKLLAGPGNTSEPVTAPSYSAGIGIEVWLPEKTVWNDRIRNYGGGGFIGGGHRHADRIGSKVPALVNANIGYAVGTTDGGHEQTDGTFMLKTDGTVNQPLMHDWSYRSLVEQATKTAALVKAYYGREHKFAYFDGHSEGGRGVMKVAQDYPELYHGYLAYAPGINFLKKGMTDFYPQMVMKNELGFTALDTAMATAFAAKFTAVNARAVASCDNTGLGFLLDPYQCGYLPARDAGALCAGVAGDGVTGTSTDAGTCVTAAEARAINKIWYGATIDGSYDPNATADVRSGRARDLRLLWWGYTRGTDITGKIKNASSTDYLAMLYQDPGYAYAGFVNAATMVRNKWTQLSYQDLAIAYAKDDLLQPVLGNIDTDRVDLSKLRDLGRKLLVHHGLADDGLPASGTVNYYTRVAARMGGDPEVQKFLRLYLEPGAAHSSQGRGYTVSGNDNSVPLPKLPGNNNQAPTPDQDQMFTALVNWVEHATVPNEIVISSRDNTVSYPICVYPKKTTWNGTGSAQLASSYTCQ